MTRQLWPGLLLLALAGCATKWEVQKAPVAEVLKFNRSGDYLITRMNGNQVELRDPVVERDSVIGIELADPLGPDLHTRRAIPVSDVKQVAVREHDGTATAIWIAVGGTFVVLIAFGVAFAAAIGD